MRTVAVEVEAGVLTAGVRAREIILNHRIITVPVPVWIRYSTGTVHAGYLYVRQYSSLQYLYCTRYRTSTVLVRNTVPVWCTVPPGSRYFYGTIALHSTSSYLGGYIIPVPGTLQYLIRTSSTRTLYSTCTETYCIAYRHFDRLLLSSSFPQKNTSSYVL